MYNRARSPVFPATAIYHPKAPDLVFADTAAYLRWKEGVQGRPVVAIAFHQQTIAAEQTGLVDDLIARIEAAGAVPLAFYSPVMDNTTITQLLAPQGKPLAQVLVNTQITLNPEGRRKEFEALGIPVIQAMSYRKGNADAWWNDTTGIALEEAASRIIDIVDARAEKAGSRLRRPAGIAKPKVAWSPQP